MKRGPRILENFEILGIGRSKEKNKRRLECTKRYHQGSEFSKMIVRL